MNKADLQAFFEAEEVTAGIVHDMMSTYNDQYEEYSRNDALDSAGADFCCEICALLDEVSTKLCEIDDLIGQVDRMEKGHDQDAIAALRKAGF